ncbi:MAG: ATP-dependent metallopeptidase FtsH/Yme1/Tma family protein [Cellulosilyticum sp.]|nr:ATP-dependent metallopeptidase FtsH/Yme1/Tma family protein [Cellulosilyticum sp.]
MKKAKKNNKYIQYASIALVVILVIVGLFIQKHHQAREVSYTNFMTLLTQGKVAEVDLNNGATFKFKLKDKNTTYITDNPRREDFKEILLLNNVEVNETAETISIVQMALSSMTMLGIGIFIFYQIRRGGARNGNMGLNNTKVEAKDLVVDFSHIAGNIEAKEQVYDIIDFIKTPEKYNKLGAKMPRGIMLYGPPGTGKTLMAKAIAKEANVPFFSVSGSDFVQLYVGVGASRVRELFKEANKYEKAVIFIDEIDAIGKKRGQNAFQGNDEKDQTLNALLTEMSGFKGKEGIVVIAATNRLDTLDEALLRPGRFDRHIEIGYPDVNAREAIIKLYLKDRPIAEEVSSSELAKQTVFFTGAMLENLINEAAIEAANKGDAYINNSHLEIAFYTIIAGKEKKDRSSIRELDRQITAYHEAGHALVTKLLAPDNSVTKVTIIPSTKGTGGFSMNIPKDKFYLNRQEIIARIKISLAGRAAEEIIFGKDYITTGASNDIEKASEDLRGFMLKYGMDDEMGLINISILTGKDTFQDEKWLAKSQDYMKQFYEETKRLIQEHEEILRNIAEYLLEKETLNEKELASFFE